MGSAPTPFAAILQRAVEHTPGAVGGTFAASDGETVDLYTTWDRYEWQVLTAHHGVLFELVRSALRVFHHGDPVELVIRHRRLCVLLHAVDPGYFALLAVWSGTPLAAAQRHLARATALLRREMAV